jgi:hypothetical protein
MNLCGAVSGSRFDKGLETEGIAFETSSALLELSAFALN